MCISSRRQNADFGGNIFFFENFPKDGSALQSCNASNALPGKTIGSPEFGTVGETRALQRERPTAYEG